MDRPRLLVLNRLLAPSHRALLDLAEIRGKLTPDSDAIELKGLFVLAVAALETMLTETYLYYLRSSPEAFDLKNPQFSKDDLVSANLAMDLIEQEVERVVMSDSYGSFRDILTKFVKTLSIADPPFSTDILDKLVEAKETRNLILHNNLRVNRWYVLRAGPCRRQVNGKQCLPLGVDYVQDVCLTIDSMVQGLQSRLQEKYASYTRLAALKRLWAFLFKSPIMPFDDFRIVDSTKDEVVVINVPPMEKSISHSERAFLAVWRANFNGWKDPSGILPMCSLGLENKQKMLYFLAMLADFDVT